MRLKSAAHRRSGQLTPSGFAAGWISTYLWTFGGSEWWCACLPINSVRVLSKRNEKFQAECGLN